MREHFPFQEAQNAIVDMLHDYLAEKEHAERLETENSILMKKTDRLMAEVERLRKAGDAMADWFKYNDCRDCRNDFNGWMTQAWNAAKEGKPSV